LSHISQNIDRKKPTPIAITKLRRLLPNPKTFETAVEQRYETKVWTMKMIGIIASSASLSAVNCEASLVKTGGLSALSDVFFMNRDIYLDMA